MPTTPRIRTDAELYASAKAVGALMGRRPAQQIAHWARIGQELAASGSVSLRDVARVLEGRAEYDRLESHEQSVVRAGGLSVCPTASPSSTSSSAGPENLSLSSASTGAPSVAGPHHWRETGRCR